MRNKITFALALVAIASSASAVDFHGYFREGVGINASKGGNQACFSVGGIPKPRLGNECDLYGEWELSQTIYKDDAGAEARYTLMFAYGLANTVAAENGGTVGTTPGSSYGYGTGNIYIQQNWAGMKLPQLGGATIWAGDRYYKREDVHSYDYFYYNPHQGHPTVGIEDVDLGVAKMAFAVTVFGQNDARGAYYLPTVHLYGIQLVENWSFQLVGNVAIASHQSGFNDALPWKTGYGITAEVLADKLFGGTNKLTFQYGNDSFLGAGQFAPDPSVSGQHIIRVIDQLYYNPTPEFSGALVVMYRNQPWADDMSFELRPAYHFSDYFKFAVDASYQIWKPKVFGTNTSTADQNLFKLTAAPTLVAGRGYWARPEFRLFATYGKWNTEAGNQGGFFGTDTNGVTIGAQVEAWW